MVRQAWELDTQATGYLAFVQRYRPMLAQWQAPVAQGLDDAMATLLRILLIHDHRCLQLLPPSERYLDGHLRLANGVVPLCTPLLQRFQPLDPLNIPL